MHEMHMAEEHGERRHGGPGGHRGGPGAGAPGFEARDRRGDPRVGGGMSGRGGRGDPRVGGGMSGRGGRGGRRGRGGPRVGRGDVRAATLLLLDEQPLHGYQIIQMIEERSGGIWRPSAGSVYPALQLLEDESLVRAEQEDGRRVFHLTETGRAYVAEHRDELTAARDAVTDTVSAGWVELHDDLRQAGAALRQVAQVGTPAQIAAARDLLANTRRQLYRILADDEPPANGERP